MGEEIAARAIAIVGAGAILPDAQNVAEFWSNIKNGLYSITAVPSDRWDPELYFDPDPKAPEKTYSKIGGWVRNYPWDPMKWKLAIPPRVANAMDGGQKWALACTRDALADYGYPERPLDADRTAVILGNAMAGEQHYLTSLRINFPEYARELSEAPSFAALPASLRNDITRELRHRIGKLLPEITEDSMPGELANCIAGRVANAFNFHGPNFTADAACASTMAAINSAVEGLLDRHFDVAVTGGVDRNMAAATFVKFCKIGALSSTGSRPFAEGADGFVMGEGAAIFLLKRLADAVRDGDKIYAVIRGIGAASDGKGKGITAPNPVGQTLAIERAWKNAGLSPETATYIEGHGTSTSVGDFVEVESMTSVLRQFDLRPGSIALGSVKSNIGHLKGAAGAAGLLKGALALRDRVLPPSLNCEHRNPNVDFAHSPLAVNTELRVWPNGKIRRMGASAFGFGGTNWHVVLEEYVPDSKPASFHARAAEIATPDVAAKRETTAPHTAASVTPADNRKAPLRGALVVGAESAASLVERLRTIQEAAAEGRAPARVAPADMDLRAPERVAIDYADAPELAAKALSALKALKSNQPAVWKALRAQGIFKGQGPAPKLAFLYTGQGSQYANMLRPLRALEPIVADAFAEADRIMQPVLGKPLSDFIFVDSADPAAVEQAERDLSRTEITQPAVLTVDMALTRLMAAYGITPDFVMGHSLGEYGALVAAGALPFADALHAVAARGREMARVSLNDNGKMAAVFAPLPEIQKILSSIDGYVVIANINSGGQAVIGGASTAVEKAVQVFLKAGYNAIPLPVSHAFHTSIVAPASEPLRAVLKGLRLGSPRVPVITNVTGDFYPTGSSVVPQMIDLLGRQVASPVQFIKGLETLWDAGARIFVEVGPKKALQGFAESVLAKRGDVAAFFTNHPKFDDAVAFSQALCGLYAAGLGTRERARPADAAAKLTERTESPEASPREPRKPVDDKPVVITGAALGLPGTDRIFDDSNVARILSGEQLIHPIPEHFRRAMAEKHITRLVKTDNGGPVFENIDNPSDVIQLAGRGGAFDLQSEFGISAERVPALDRVTQLAIAAGLDALRDAGIPLVLRYKTTTTGSKLPDRWGLPEFMRDGTGVIFASCWPGFDSFAEYLSDHYQDRARREQLATLESVRQRALELSDGAALRQDLDRRIADLRAAIEKEPLIFDRRFLLRTLAMGHSQFAELIGARGPNIAMNSACASTPQAVALAQDWIRAGRCRRVIVIAADDVTSDNLIEWILSGFLASGAAATDKNVEEAALPFDKRRHGMLVGMGAMGIVVESADSASERGLRPICEVLSAVTANSAFHGTRLDIEHICQVMERLVRQAESRPGFSRREAAPKMMFVSHETYTPARGGSASAEINALRRTFGQDAERIVIANTKGLTGHTMGTGIEDVVAVKALETGCIPAVPNFKEVDPELGQLNLSKGGEYPVDYALRLGAGFGSQISMTLLRRVPAKDDQRASVTDLGYAYRIEDEAAWKAWLDRAACGSPAELEVVRRTLRIRDRKGAAVTVNGTGHSKPAAIEPEERIPAAQLPAAVVAEPAAAASKTEPTASAAEPAPVPESAAAAGISGNDEAVKERILELVVEKTGYPKDMLALDLDLEADLGVDTVKQAELFAAVREIYNIPRDPNLKLRDFPTLAHVIGFVKDRRPDLAGALQAALQTAQATAAAAAAMAAPGPDREPVVEAASAAPLPAQGGTEAIQEQVLNLVVEKTGYPKDMLDLDLDFEADLGVDTVKQAELLAAIREIYGIPRDPNLKLRDFPTLSAVIGFVKDRRPDLAGAPRGEDAATTPPAAVASEPVSEPVAAPASPAAPAIEGGLEAIKDRILELVVEKTGYPKDMLDLDLDLEADLGVDTVKQAEMFAAIREIYAIPRDPNLKLREFPTLAAVIGFVKDRRPDLVVAPQPVAQAAVPLAAAAAASIGPPQPGPVPAVVLEPAAVAAAPNALPPPAEGGIEAVKERILDLVVEKTGYPKEMLDLDLDLEADLGVDTVKQAELFAAIRETYSIPRDANIKLRDFPTLAHVIGFVTSRRPDLAEAGQAETRQAASADAPATSPVSAAPAAEAAVAPQEAIASVTGPAPQAAEGAVEAIRERILDLVIDKTGYPKEMLDLDLDLEADLGVDTVKQAELFAAIRETYNIPRDATVKLRDFPTLAHVIGFVTQRRPDLAGAPGATPAAETQAPSPATEAGEEIVAQPPRFIAEQEAPEAVREKVLQIVAEKTGYPLEMLDLDLDLEADLGIDTVKQAEMFASVRQTFGIARDTDLKLRDFPTLAHVIQFAMRKGKDSARAKNKAPAPAPVEAPQTPRPEPASFEATDRIPRRVPVPRPRQPLALSKPTGVSLGPGSRVVVAADQGGAGEALTQRLKAMGVEVIGPENIGNGIVQGVYWLPALDDEGALADMDLPGWRAALQGRVKSLYAAMRGLYDQIAKPGTFLISATRLGGQHGYNQDGATCPLGGAVAGFTKAYKRERNDALVKTIDFELRNTAADIAGKLIDEALRDPGAVEIGYADGQRWTVELEEQPPVDGKPGLRLGPDTVFLITGAAGGITSAITADLASASGGTFYLIDLAPEPDPNNSDLARFTADKDGLKRDLFARMAARGERATPARVEQELFLIERTLAAKSAIDAVRAAGGKARYFSVDLTDANAAAKVIDEVRKESGHIDALLHAAGMERSHFLPDKNQREFDLVFDVKADGWFNLMHAIGDMPLGAAVVFSSIAGRFGNAGQTDYSAANDLLCKIVSSFRTTRPATRGIAIDWTAWGGIGMASRGSIPKMMELAGIDMISPEAGVPFIRRELTAGARSGEIVVAERLGILAKEWDETGGVDPAATDAARASFPSLQGPMIGRVVSMTAGRGLVIETTLDPKVQPFLNDHRIDGTPVLPGVMGIEAFAEAAQCILPGWHIATIDNVDFAAPFKFYRDEPRTFTIEVDFRQEGGEIVASCRLIGIRQLPHPLEPQITTHFTGLVRLSKTAPKPQAGAAPYGPGSPVMEAREIYRRYFHGPAYQVMNRAWSNGESVIGEMARDLPGNHYPGNLPTLALPRCIELCFQTAGIWKMAAEGKMALPLHVDRITLPKHPDETAARAYAVAAPDPHGDGLDAEVVDESGNHYVGVAGYRTVTLSDASGAEQMKALLHPAVAAGR